MLRLRRSILTPLLSSPISSRIASFHRLLSAAAPAVLPGPRFAVEDYLVDTCGLTREQALKASTKIPHLKPPAKPNAVLAFLAGLGLSSAQVAAVVAKDPKFLCAGVERTLAPNVVALTGLGLSHSEIGRLVSLSPVCFRCRTIVSNLPYCLSLFGSYENLLHVLNKHPRILMSSLEKVIKPNVAFLREWGLSACDFTKVCSTSTRLLTFNPERLQVITACVEGLGLPRGSVMFRHALHGFPFLSEEKIAAQVEYLKNTFRWSDAEVSVAVSKHPCLLLKSNEHLQQRSEFLFSQVGLEPAYIAHRPALISYSLEGRLKPRYYAVKFLKENGLLKRDASYYTAVRLTEKVFVEKFICPHKDAAPHLSEDYAVACKGALPTNFRFT